jgi:hypothetical protein
VEGEKKERERIYPRSPRVSLLPCVQAQKTRTKSWVLKRGQRERERWSARVVTLSDLQRKRRRNKRRRRKGSFGRNSFEFRKIQNLVQVAVGAC